MTDALDVPVRTRGLEGLDILLSRVGAGDDAAFEQLYLATAPRLLGLVRRVLRDPHQSEEVTQEVYLEIWRSASRFDTVRGRSLSWMFTMAHRRAIDRVRASQASRDRDLRQGAREHPIDYDTVAEQGEAAFESIRIKRAMDQLTPSQRRAIDLCYFEGLTATEAASVCHIPVSTLKTRLRSGLLQLRRLMETSTDS